MVSVTVAVATKPDPTSLIATTARSLAAPKACRPAPSHGMRPNIWSWSTLPPAMRSAFNLFLITFTVTFVGLPHFRRG